MVGHHHISLLETFAGFKERALLNKTATTAATLNSVGGHHTAYGVLYGTGPPIEVTIPTISGHGLNH